MRIPIHIQRSLLLIPLLALTLAVPAFAEEQKKRSWCSRRLAMEPVDLMFLSLLLSAYSIGSLARSDRESRREEQRGAAVAVEPGASPVEDGQSLELMDSEPSDSDGKDEARSNSSER